MPVGNPCNHLDITQSARTFLDVWLQVIGSVVILFVAGELFLALYFKKILTVPDFCRSGTFLHTPEHVFRP